MSFYSGGDPDGAEDFIREVLAVQLRAAWVIVGPDFRFGHDRKGDVRLLEEMGKQYGFQVEVLEKETMEGRAISSTWIRESLREGNMERVNELLGYPYFVRKEVVHGRQLGRTLGNAHHQSDSEDGKLLPPFGVYASRTTVGGETYFGISNVGVKPTVEVPLRRRGDVSVRMQQRSVRGWKPVWSFTILCVRNASLILWRN